MDNGHQPDGTAGSMDQGDVEQLIKALNLIYDARSSNEHRKDATIFLDEVKTRPSAPSNGFLLASDRSRPAIARHYGLSLLEFYIRYRWQDCSAQEFQAVRDWVLNLAQTVDKADPAFYRNKVAQLWAELAKRFWITQWQDMDTALVELWQRSYVHQEIVLQVLETLSDEAFSKEEGLAAIRGSGDLGKACVEIFTPTDVWSELFPGRDSSLGLRCGDEGWLTRLNNLLQWCLEQNPESDPNIGNAAISAFAVLRSVMTWMVPRVVARSSCIDLCCQYLTKTNVLLRMVTYFVLYWGRKTTNII